MVCLISSAPQDRLARQQPLLHPALVMPAWRCQTMQCWLLASRAHGCEAPAASATSARRSCRSCAGRSQPGALTQARAAPLRSRVADVETFIFTLLRWCIEPLYQRQCVSEISRAKAAIMQQEDAYLRVQGNETSTRQVLTARCLVQARHSPLHASPSSLLFQALM